MGVIRRFSGLDGFVSLYPFRYVDFDGRACVRVGDLNGSDQEIVARALRRMWKCSGFPSESESVLTPFVDDDQMRQRIYVYLCMRVQDQRSYIIIK